MHDACTCKRCKLIWFTVLTETGNWPTLTVGVPLMKLILTTMLVLSTFGAWAQTDPAIAKKPALKSAATTNTVELATPPVGEGSVSMKAVQALKQDKPVPPKPNEIKTDSGTYSGVLPQLVKTDSPLQLVNPAAPKEYGEAKDNAVYDSRTGKAEGIKLFSFSWFTSDKKKAKKAAASKTDK
jgi:hypothetical protein